ncbi:hypothetical protein Bca4012_020859 [Brassica carinata]
MLKVLLWEQEKNESNGQQKEQCPSTRCRSHKRPGVLAGEATATKVTDVASFPKRLICIYLQTKSSNSFLDYNQKNGVFLGFKTVYRALLIFDHRRIRDPIFKGFGCISKVLGIPIGLHNNHPTGLFSSLDIFVWPLFLSLCLLSFNRIQL